MNNETAIKIERIRFLWHEFLYQSAPGTHTYRDCKCGGLARGTSMCATCIADELLTHGIDVTKPKWGRDENNRIKRLWAVEWVCEKMAEA